MRRYQLMMFPWGLGKVGVHGGHFDTLADALDEARKMRMEREMLDRAIEERLHHRLGASVPPHPPALGDQREDRRQPPFEHGLVERPLVAEVVVEARLVLEAGPRRDLPHRHAGVPTLGKLALMMSLLGIGALPAIVGLWIATLLPIIRNTYEGIRAVPAHLVDAARGMGMGPSAVLRRVELPNALFVIFAGVRTAMAVNVGTALDGSDGGSSMGAGAMAIALCGAGGTARGCA